MKKKDTELKEKIPGGGKQGDSLQRTAVDLFFVVLGNRCVFYDGGYDSEWLDLWGTYRYCQNYPDSHSS